MENKQQYLDRNKAAKQAARKLIIEAKSVPCVDCGISYPHYVMDLDHLNPEIKLGTLGEMASRGIHRVKVEIAKCEPVCANCHRERTHGSVPLGGEEPPKLLEN